MPPEQPEARMAAVGRVPVMRCRSGEDVRPSRTPASARVRHILSYTVCDHSESENFVRYSHMISEIYMKILTFSQNSDTIGF